MAAARYKQSFHMTSSPPLQHHTWAHLYQTLGVWMKQVAEDKLQMYVQNLGLQQFQRRSLCVSLLRGMAQAMALPNPPSHCWTTLCSSVETAFSLLPSHIQVGSTLFYSSTLLQLHLGTTPCCHSYTLEHIHN